MKTDDNEHLSVFMSARQSGECGIRHNAKTWRKPQWR
jgi:hypothetical protein